MVFHQPSGQLKAMFSVIVIIIIITIAISNHLCVCCIMRIKFIVWKAIQLFLCHFITPLIVSFQISAKEDIFIPQAIILYIQYIIHRISFKIQIHPNGSFHPCIINIILREELKHFFRLLFSANKVNSWNVSKFRTPLYHDYFAYKPLHTNKIKYTTSRYILLIFKKCYILHQFTCRDYKFSYFRNIKQILIIDYDTAFK